MTEEPEACSSPEGDTKARQAAWAAQAREMQTLERTGSGSSLGDDFRDVEPLSLQSALSCKLHRRKDWRLVVTGHSLGAGVAVLLSTHLRTYYPGAWGAVPRTAAPTHCACFCMATAT